MSHESRSDNWNAELPSIDVSFGVGDRFQLSYVVPRLCEREGGSPTVSGWGNPVAGVKWRFYDGGAGGLAVSVFPKVEFDRTSSASVDDEGAGRDSVLRLPFQVAQEIGGVVVVGQIGREFRADGDRWFYGLSVARQVNRSVQVGVEFAGQADADLGRSHLIANVAVACDLGVNYSLVASVGRELHNHEEPRAQVVGYVGLQWRL